MLCCACKNIRWPRYMGLPLKRWNRNYITALKILELDLSPAKQVDKMLLLLEWMSTMENAPRLDLSGQPAGIATATQAMHAKQQCSRQRGQDRRHRAKRKEGGQAPAAVATVERDTN
ncbi:hypothetical protein CCL16_02705 [Pseudomonas syringae]|nr:hypothetical protein CCL16_02705 [Pseudomonas syringae]